MKEINVHWSATAPSNLALIKYAGKKTKGNLPLNSSLSYTLDHLITKVRLQALEEKEDRWQALKEEGFHPLELKTKASERFLNFFKILKKKFNISGSYLLESANNFPAAAGAASSASSFCALTRATYELAQSHIKNMEDLRPEDLSRYSREGSGSSCRSFFSPWALWKEEEARPLQLPFPRLIHQLILTDSKEKKVSSSAAHEKIISSPHFKTRVERAEKRLALLLSALNKQDWQASFEIIREEFLDLHTLYESVGIFYRSSKSLEVIQRVNNYWEKFEDGPWITMDAGSSVHLLYRPDQREQARYFSSLLGKKYSVLES